MNAMAAQIDELHDEIAAAVSRRNLAANAEERAQAERDLDLLHASLERSVAARNAAL